MSKTPPGRCRSKEHPEAELVGGPKGFLRVIDETTLGFVDYKGNRQYISAGNVTENDQAYLFLMDYPNRRRVKIWGRAEVVEGASDLLSQLKPEGYKAQGERVFLFHVEAWDVNCPQHIEPRSTAEEVQARIGRLTDRVAELEAEVVVLRHTANTESKQTALSAKGEIQ